jgi:NAD(P)-dependent dehydrogenase (short-subunit alcohol dehydrogenase family)
MGTGTTRWTADQVGSQAGRTAVVTGANTGVGVEAARLLAERGATVVLACRDRERARAAADRIAAGPSGRVAILQLDLGSLASVRAAADRLRTDHPRIDLLINNAGVMGTPYGHTADGFELQFGTNHLGHFAFTGLVLDALRSVPDSRIVTVTSPTHRQGSINFADLQSARRYRSAAAYAQSKLANLLFAYELQHRLAAAGAGTSSLAAHPGAARTEINRHLPWPVRLRSSWWLAWPFTHAAEIGALALLRAAVDPAAAGGEYYCPDGWLEFRGHPVRRESSAHSHDADLRRRLWEESERLTGVIYRLAPSVTSPE